MAKKQNDRPEPAAAHGEVIGPGALSGMARLAAALLLATASVAPAATLYKSIAADGGITYSDVPQPGAATVEELVIPPPASAPELYPASYSDERAQADSRISRANADLDAAEYALAQARRPLWAMKRGLISADMRMSEVDYAQIDALKHDVAESRKSLVQAIRQRNSLN